MRWRLIVDTEVSRETADGTQFIPAFLSSVNVELFNDENDDLEEQVDVAIDMVNRRLTDFEGQGSGWRLHGIDRVAIQCSKHSPITGSSYIPTPMFIKSRKAIVNVKNVNDDLCFLYSVLAHIHPVDGSQNPNQAFHYKPFLQELDYSGLTFPLKIRQIRKFEDQNPHISINVLYHDPETRTIMPLRVTKHRNRIHHVNLFLLYDDGAQNDSTENPPIDATTETPAEETEAEPKYHYTLVRNLSALLRQDTKENGTMYVCPYCLHVFCQNKKKYETHLIDCKIHKPQVIELPDPDDVKKNNVSFRNVFKSFPVQFCLYVDFECFLGESDGSRKNVQQIHEVSGFCMLRVTTEPTLNKCKPYLYSGENVMEEFYRHLQQEQDEIDFYLRTNLPMKPLTPEEQQRHDDAVECEQCHKPFENTRAMRKVRHHLHLTGKYAMSVCSSCNLQLKPRVRREFRERYFFDDDDDNESQHGNHNFVDDWCEDGDLLEEGGVPGGIENGRASEVTKGHFFIPVIPHNMKGYDSHIILKHLTKQFPDEQIQVIANNQEKYIAFDMGPFRFIDSLQFLGCSLDTLVSNLSRDGTSKFNLTRRFYRDDEKTLEI